MASQGHAGDLSRRQVHRHDDFGEVLGAAHAGLLDQGADRGSDAQSKVPDQGGVALGAQAPEEVELLAEYLRGFTAEFGLIAPDPVETARMFTGGLVQIRRDRFSNPGKLPPRGEVEQAVSRYVDNFITTVLPSGIEA